MLEAIQGNEASSQAFLIASFLLVPRSCLPLFSVGDPLIADAEDDKGLSGAAAPLVIWLLAFSLQGLFNVGYSCYLLWANNTWGRYKWEGFFELSIKFLKVRK